MTLMSHRTIAVRRHTRFPVRWPVLYGCADFVSEGTVLDVTPYGWRIAGAMPVQPGMTVTLQVWAEDRPGAMRLEQARVLWVKGCEFALDAPQMAPDDRRWIDAFLDHKLSLDLMRHAPTAPLSSKEQAMTPLTFTPPQGDEATPQSEIEYMARGRVNTNAEQSASLSRQDARRLFTGMRVREITRRLTGRDSILDS
jgi:hypothetical protein